MSKKLLLNERQRKYYDVEVQCTITGTVTKRVYIDELKSHMQNYDCKEWEIEGNVITEDIGQDEFNNNNEKFAELIATELIESDEILENIETNEPTSMYATEGSEIAGDEIWQCVICKEHYTGYDNNPDPVADTGGCCDTCNTNKVIPARMAELMHMNHLGV